MTTSKNPADAPVRGILDVIVFSSLAAAAVVLTAAVRVAQVFRPEGVAVRMPLPGDVVELNVGGADPTDLAAVDATVLVAGVGAWGLAAFTASIVLAAASALVVLAALIRIALVFRSGRFFTRATTRALTLIGGTIFAGSCAVLFIDALGRNAAYEAIGVPYETIHLLDLVPFLPLWAAAIAIAMLAGAFERGQRMQRDTDLLV